MPCTSLHHIQGSCSLLADPVGGDLLGVVGDVLQAVHYSRSPLAFTLVAPSRALISIQKKEMVIGKKNLH